MRRQSILVVATLLLMSGSVSISFATTASFQGLGDLPGVDFRSVAFDVSANGSVVVGDSSGKAFIWDAGNGMQSLKELLVNDFGLDLTGWSFTQATGISADGMTIVGYGYNPIGNREAWIASILEPTIGGYIDWTDLAAFCERWLDEGCSDVNDWCGRADINRDTKVDFTDYSWLAKYLSSIAPEPNAATNPDPYDTATDVNITSDLSWIAGSDTAAHGVYFGTNPTPDANEFQGYQTETIFDPGLMDVNIIYYWQVDEVGLGGETIGEVWSFTVNLLGTYNPFPSDGATYVPTNVTCTWEAGTILDGVSGNYDVFFGTDEADVNDAEFGDPEWLDDPPEADPQVTPSDIVTVEKYTEYFWRVASLDEDWHTLHRGTVWSFTTLPYPFPDPCFIGWWTFKEPVGTSAAYDWTGWGNDGNINGDLERVPGIFDNAMDFPGSGAWVELPTGMVDSSIGSVCMWIKTTQSSRGHLFFGTNDTGDGWGGQQELHVSMENGGGVDFYIEGATTNVEIGSPPVNDDDWHHIAATWESPGDAKLYVDGGTPLTQAHTGDIFSFTQCIRLGMPWDPERYFDGLMDDVRLYKRVLTEAEIQEGADRG